MIKRRIVLAAIATVALTVSPAYAYDDGGNGSGDGCYHGGCDTRHEHKGDTCISPCSITIIVPPPTSACEVPAPWHCDPPPKNTPSTTTTTRKEGQ